MTMKSVILKSFLVLPITAYKFIWTSKHAFICVYILMNAEPLLMFPSPPPPSPRTGIRNHYFLPLGHFSLVSATILKSGVLKVTEVSFYFTQGECLFHVL